MTGCMTVDLDQERRVAEASGSWGVIGYRAKDPAELRVRAIRLGIRDSKTGIAEACGISYGTMTRIMRGSTVSAVSMLAVFHTLSTDGELPSALFDAVAPASG
jgi:hypothetical protein